MQGGRRAVRLVDARGVRPGRYRLRRWVIVAGALRHMAAERRPAGAESVRAGPVISGLAENVAVTAPNVGRCGKCE